MCTPRITSSAKASLPGSGSVGRPKAAIIAGPCFPRSGRKPIVAWIGPWYARTWRKYVWAIEPAIGWRFDHKQCALLSRSAAATCSALARFLPRARKLDRIRRRRRPVPGPSLLSAARTKERGEPGLEISHTRRTGRRWLMDACRYGPHNGHATSKRPRRPAVSRTSSANDNSSARDLAGSHEFLQRVVLELDALLEPVLNRSPARRTRSGASHMASHCFTTQSFGKYRLPVSERLPAGLFGPHMSNEPPFRDQRFSLVQRR